MLSHRARDYVVPLTLSFTPPGALSCWLCPYSHWESFHQDISVYEFEWIKVSSRLTHALLLESAALAAPKRHLGNKEMGGSQKIQCHLGVLPWLTATEWSDGGKRQLPAPCSPADCQSFSCSWSVALTAQACTSAASHQKGTTLLDKVLQWWTVFACGYLPHSPADLGRGFGRGSADNMGWTSNETPSFLLFWKWTCVYISVLVWTRKIFLKMICCFCPLIMLHFTLVVSDHANHVRLIWSKTRKCARRIHSVCFSHQ